MHSLKRVVVLVGLVGLLSAGLVPANATFPGPAVDLFIVEAQLDPDTGATSFAGLSRYEADGTFDRNSRIWVGASQWGYGSFVTCDDVQGDGDIFFFPGDFSEPTQITSMSGDHYDPAVSPDGSTVAFSSDAEGRRQICLMQVGDTVMDCVTGASHDGEDWAPVWNPHNDGVLMFVSNIDGDADLYSWGPGGDYDDWYDYPATDNNVADFGPDFSPTEMDVIVYSSVIGGRDHVFTMNLNDREPQQLTNDSNANYEPVYSPDGQQIAFVKQDVSTPGSFGKVYLMPVGGGAAMPLDAQDDADTEYTHPEWAQETGDGCEPNCEPPFEERWFGNFKLVKHLKAKGQLFSDSGGDICLEDQSVKIQRKTSSGWKTVGTEQVWRGSSPWRSRTSPGAIEASWPRLSSDPPTSHGSAPQPSLP
jgi:hypothetical protein